MDGLSRIVDRLRRVSVGPVARLASDRRGATAVLVAISLTALAGFAGLGAEVASWYTVKRTMQGAADAASSTAAAALAAGEPSSTFASLAKSVAASFHFVDGSNDTTVIVNYPPLSGPNQSGPAVEVIIEQIQKPLLTGVFFSAGPTISSRAVSRANTSRTGQGCVVALDPNNESGLIDSSSAALVFNGCSLYVNSPSTSALDLTGGTMSAASAYVVGGVGGTGLTTTGGIYTGVDPLIDPYLTAAVPAYSGCNSPSNGYKLNAKPDTINVGTSGVYVFCGGLTLDGGAILTLGPGTFIIDRGLLKITGGSTLTALNGTTLILTTSNPSSGCATTKLDGGDTISITAPTSGALSGIAIYQDRACTDTTQTNFLSGGSTQNITGAIYFPGEPVSYYGGSAIGGANCTQLIAWTITFTGGATFNSGCAGSGTRSVSLTGGRLSE
jgi:hypothetical protein